MNVYERLAAVTTPKLSAQPSTRTALTEKRRPNTTAYQNHPTQSSTAPTSRPAAQIPLSKGRSQVRTLGKSQSQSSLRKIKSVENDMRPTTAPLETPILSGTALCSDTQIDRDEATITTLAQTIKEANYILIGTGAGFSADSGLAVYKDIARVPAYDLMGVDYATLCDPIWLHRNPEVFYGFWGYCFNSYRDTTPHEGYTIIKNMITAYPNKRIYIYSSNVDSHFEKIGVPRQHFYEFHGTCMDWQCSRSCRVDSIYRLPFYYRFNINKQTMRCSAGSIVHATGGGPGSSSTASTTIACIPRPPPILSRFTKPSKNTSVFSQLYSSYYGDSTMQDSSSCSQVVSILPVQEASVSRSVSPLNNINPPVRTDVKKGSPIIRREVYDRVYSQGSRNSQTRSALHDALAKQGIDYLAIKHEAKRVCSLSSFSTLTTTSTPTLSQEGIHSAKSVPKVCDSTGRPIQLLSVTDDTTKETHVEEEPLPINKDTLLPPNASSINKGEDDYGVVHDPTHIESNYKKIYESVRPIASQDNDGHPICPHCKYYLRPRVLMFDDAMFMEITDEEAQYNSFKRQLFRNKNRKVCLLEIGCGVRIPTIRHEFNSILRRCAKSDIPCSLFRINPERKRARTASRLGPPQFYHIAQGGKDVMIHLANILNIPY